MVRRIITVCCVLVVLAGPPIAGHAASLVVTSSADSGPGSLREAITVANSNGEADFISFTGSQTIVLSTRLPDVTSEIAITGNGSGSTIVDGGNPPGGWSGVTPLIIRSAGILTLQDVTLQNGLGCNTDTPGAIKNQGVLVLRNCRCESNRGDYGGCLENSGNATIENCLVANNRADWEGGGLYSGYGTLTIKSTVIRDNTTPRSGGGVSCYSGETVDIRDSVISGNSDAYSAGGVWCSPNVVALTMENCSVSGNTSSGATGGVDTWASTVVLQNVTVTENSGIQGGGIMGGLSYQLRNTIIAANVGGNCLAPVTSNGHNLEDANTCGFGAAGDMVDTDPLLGPLQDNGGGTLTHELLPGSPAMDAGDPTGAPATDQRGLPRPADGDGDGISAVDMGAFEAQPLFADGFESGDTSAWNLALP